MISALVLSADKRPCFSGAAAVECLAQDDDGWGDRQPDERRRAEDTRHGLRDPRALGLPRHGGQSSSFNSKILAIVIARV